MPYIYLGAEYDPRLHPSATTIRVGIAQMDLLQRLEAKLMPEYKTEKKYYEIDDSPEVVMTKLEDEGYYVVGFASNNDSLIWTLHKR